MSTSATDTLHADRHHELRGWTAFAHSTLGQVAAIVAIAALGLTATVPADQVPWSARIGQFVLVFIALGCTAVLSYRDDPQR